MTRPRGKCRQAAKRPVAATPGASPPLDASVLSIVANLEGLDLNGLRRQWRGHLGGEAPAHLPRWLLIRVVAYRLQADAFGDVGKSIRRIDLDPRLHLSRARRFLSSPGRPCDRSSRRTSID
jgi:Protein of unknown function (DUF2924)